MPPPLERARLAMAAVPDGGGARAACTARQEMSRAMGMMPSGPGMHGPVLSAGGAAAG